MSKIRVLAIITLAVCTLDAAAQDLPPRAFQRIGTSKLRHGSRIQALAYSPDGNHLVAGGGNDPVRVWNPKTGDLVREISEHNVTCLTFSESGRTLVCAGYQKIIRLINMENNKETGRLEGHKAVIKAIAVAPDAVAVASGSQDGVLSVWEWNAKRKAYDLPGHTDEVTAVAWSPIAEDNILVSGSSDRTVIIWNCNVDPPKLKHKLDAGGGVCSLAFTPDGKTVYSAGEDHRIRRWDVETGKQTAVFVGHEGPVTHVSVAGDEIISASLDRTVRIWDVKTTKQLRSLTRGAGDCEAFAASKAGDSVAMGGINNTVRVFDAKAAKEVPFGDGETTSLTTLAASKDGQRLLSLTPDGQILAWNWRKSPTPTRWDSKVAGETLLALAPDDTTLAIASSTVRLWNAQTGAEIAQLPIKASEPIAALAFSPDSKHLAIAHRGGNVNIWNVADRKEEARSFNYQNFTHALAWSPDGKKIAIAGGPEIALWDPEKNALIRSFKVKEGPAPTFPLVASLAWAPDSRTLAAGCFDAVIRVYDTTVKTPSDPIWLKSCEGHLAVAYALAFSADGRTLLSGSFDKTARLWEAFSGKTIATFKGHVGPVMGVAFMPDGRSVFTASTDTILYQWDVPGLVGKGQLPPLKLNFQQLETAWDDLLTDETARGHEIMWQCIANGKDTLAHLLKQEKAFLLDPEAIKKHMRDLNSPNFVVRQAAMDKLADKKHGRWLEGRYDAAIADPPSLEYKRRVEILKEKLNETNMKPLSQERIRLRRYMLMCEQLGGADAVRALQQLAAQGPEEEIRAEAQGSLDRLKKR